MLVIFTLFIFGAGVTSLYIANTTRELSRLITLYQVDHLRQNLVINIQSIQEDLYAYNNEPTPQRADSIMNDAEELKNTSRKCKTCHHPPKHALRIEKLQTLINNYEKTLTDYLSVPSGSVDGFRPEVMEIGDDLLTVAKEMTRAASRKLEVTANSAMVKINDATKILFATVLLSFALSLWVASRLTASITRPINELINATRRLASGDLEYRIAYDEDTEFAELGRTFNNMSAALKDGYERLETVNEQLQREIEERKRAEDAIKESERFLNIIFDSIRDPFCIFDSDFRIIRANEAYAELKNRMGEELIGKRCYELFYDHEVCQTCLVKKTFVSSDPCAKEKHLTGPGGEEMWIEIYTYPIFGDDGKVTHVIEYAREITDRKRAEEERKRLIGRLEYLSRTDALTGLLNRRAIIDRLEYEIKRARRHGSELSLILCDVDHFKGINDTYGHTVGDKVLQSVSKTLQASIRTTDLAGRYGGDEFMIILPETSRSGAEKLAEKINYSVRTNEFKVTDEKSISFSISLGVATFDSAEDDTDSIINRADRDLYASKGRARSRV